jgi:hypothetical protein
MADVCLRAYQPGGALIVKPLTGLDEAVRPQSREPETRAPGG